MHLSSRELTHILKVLDVNPGYNNCKYSYEQAVKIFQNFQVSHCSQVQKELMNNGDQNK